MTAQVIFLNTWLDCPEEIKRKHDMIQVMINEKKAQFEYETRDYTLFQKALSKQKSHHLWRQRMRLIKDEDTHYNTDTPDDAS